MNKAQFAATVLWLVDLSDVNTFTLVLRISDLRGFPEHRIDSQVLTYSERVNPSNAKATFVQSTSLQKILKTI